MASERKITANRSNAKQSTGPKTEAGKARSSRNAHRHGLSRLNRENDVSSNALISVMTAGFTQQQNSFGVDNLVRANLWLGRIRQARYDMLLALMESPSQKLAKRLAGLERYERPVRAAQRRVLKCWLKQG
ncbi:MULTISPECIES: hypothetical protein [unclassified Bradyrhizobium]|uniref:hypothetical protein n=1 Tax=unclassified Bradyrhizobium TaxID=2631580 RepID=UPI001FFB358B|nr:MULTISPECIES: hypothetical protein [unclassified Bradyrhizobium]MCK1331291.1 hypothetical protein [Bradyrhizobium sp. CW9]MCK1504273.1 hypothetical protein [Bradyrhizobium sp. 18]MCK1547553.1 hypothetical protein [Bradyrhizobium sp. 177]MCK1633520.1 hypothetical protein [Bradyrhizobium sp. 162]MCK1696795.1 hypothetical protein [Bradyrhizobium sp. 144]